ncbi:UNVERIFIED_CONTAM: hypothetical protein Sindi_0208700 [Sesamum indicum]
MEFSLSGNALKTFARSITCLARIGNELVFQATPSLAICSVLRTPIASIDRLSVLLADSDASKVQWTLDCFNENDSSLHTQLWIDPTEEFVQYTHTGNPVDVTFGVKELKAFLAYCEGCEVDIHLYFDKAGEPILMAPKFGLDDGSCSNFDATLVLATMLVSQLNGGDSSEPPTAATAGPPGQQGTKGTNSEHPSDHTRIWSELSGSAAKDGNGGADRQVSGERNQNINEQRTIQRMGMMNISIGNNADGLPSSHEDLMIWGGYQPDVSKWVIHHNPGQPQGRFQYAGSLIISFGSDGADINCHGFSQRHPSNWVDADEDDDEGDETELCVQSTPPYS